jgi:hypothetical protein
LTRVAEQDAKAIADADEAGAKAECSRAQKGADPRGPVQEPRSAGRGQLETAEGGQGRSGENRANRGASHHGDLAGVGRGADALPVSHLPLIDLSPRAIIDRPVGVHSPKPRKVAQKRMDKQKFSSGGGPAHAVVREAADA